MGVVNEGVRGGGAARLQVEARPVTVRAAVTRRCRIGRASRAGQSQNTERPGALTTG